jgi:hypothetical protein
MSDLLNSASLVLIPSGYKEDIVYSAVPTDGSGDLSFTRASNGTRINSSGLVEVVAWNLLEQSQSFTTSGGAWNYTAGSGVTTGQTGYDGTTNAVLFTDSGANGDYGAYQGISQLGSQTFSIYAKAGSVSSFAIDIYQTPTPRVIVNLSNGTITSGTGVIESVGNGWYRISVTAVMTTTYYVRFGCTVAGNVYIQNAQLNIGSTANPYFPTTDRLNVPRLTYQNGGGGCPSLLLEKQSTNLLSYSEDFDNAAWFKTETTVTANNTTSPDGTANADKLIPTTTNSTHYVDRSGIGVSSNGLASIFAKKGEYNRFAIRSYFTAGYAIFDVNSGVVVSTSSVTATIENVGNGWYRCSVNDTGNANYGYGIFVLQNTSTSVNAFSGNGTDGIFVWGAQLEASSYPTSYISTTSASATRVADACYKTGISSLIGQTEGTLFIDMVPTVVSGQGRYMNIYNASNTSNGWNAIISNGGTPNTFRFYGDGFDFSAGACLFGVRVKAALAYKNGVLTSAYVNGASVGTLTAVTTGKSYNTLELGSGPFGTDGSCNVNESIIFPTALTNAELASLTTL